MRLKNSELSEGLKSLSIPHFPPEPQGAANGSFFCSTLIHSWLWVMMLKMSALYIERGTFFGI